MQAAPGKTKTEDHPILIQGQLDKNYHVVEMSFNEMAEAHARHLKGCRAVSLMQHDKTTVGMQEEVFLFEFP